MIIHEDFEIHETLNPKLWNTETNKLLPEVRERLIEIVKYFEEFIQVPISILDCQIVGSNASFNYTDSSDLDLHLIANFDRVDRNTEVIQALYDAKKSDFNSKHDIKVKGIDVELYVQDVNANVVSNGVYSLCDDEWVKEPKPIKSATKHNTDKSFEKWEEKIKSALATNDYETIEQTLNTIYLVRHNSIAVDGEYGVGNELFKRIRASGLLQRLKDQLYIAKSKELTLEGLSSGGLVLTLED